MKLHATAIALALLISSASRLTAAGCEAAVFHQLDFWIGNWNGVSDKGELEGTNRVERVLSGCALIEHWTGAGGDEVKSLLYFSPNDRRWQQLWIGDTPGAVKQRHVVAQLGKSVRLQGEISMSDGRVVFDRSTLTPMDDGRVHQLIETSHDGGASWETSFEVYYIARKP